MSEISPMNKFGHQIHTDEGDHIDEQELVAILAGRMMLGYIAR